MYAKLIIDGNAVYEIDEACLLRQNQDKKKRGGKNRDRKNPGIGRAVAGRDYGRVGMKKAGTCAGFF